MNNIISVKKVYLLYTRHAKKKVLCIHMWREAVEKNQFTLKTMSKHKGV